VSSSFSSSSSVDDTDRAFKLHSNAKNPECLFFDDDVGGDDACVFDACVSWSVVEQTTTVTVPPYPFADAYLPAMARTGLASQQ